MIRAVLRAVGRGFTCGLVVLLAYLAAAVVGALVPGRIQDLPGGADVEIGLLYGPIHVDFVLPATPETRAALRFAEAGGVPVFDPAVQHFIVGWGAREFYTQTPTWADLEAGATLRAITGDASVLRVHGWPEPISPASLPSVSLSQVQYTALLRAISDSIPGDTPVAVPAPGQGPWAGFVEARGRFHIGRTCNTWISRTLRAAGVPAGAWTPTPYSLRVALWRAGV